MIVYHFLRYSNDATFASVASSGGHWPSNRLAHNDITNKSFRQVSRSNFCFMFSIILKSLLLINLNKNAFDYYNVEYETTKQLFHITKVSRPHLKCKYNDHFKDVRRFLIGRNAMGCGMISQSDVLFLRYLSPRTD